MRCFTAPLDVPVHTRPRCSSAPPAGNTERPLHGSSYPCGRAAPAVMPPGGPRSQRDRPLSLRGAPGRGQGSGGHQRPAAARRPARPCRACPEHGPPAPRPGRAAERRGAPATALLLKAKAGAPPRAEPLPGVLCQKGSPRTSGKRPQEPKARFGRVRAAISASSHLMPVSFCSNV